MQIISSLLFGVSASLDALLIGISYGVRRIRILLWQNLLISFVTLAGTCLCIGLGSFLAPLLPIFVCRLAGSGILILLGLYYLLKFMMRALKKYHQKANFTEGSSLPENAPVLSARAVLLLGAALSLNNMGIGLGASITGLQLLPAAISTLLLSVLFLFAGNRLGRSKILQLAGVFADPVSGVLLIALGVYQFFWN